MATLAFGLVVVTGFFLTGLWAFSYHNRPNRTEHGQALIFSTGFVLTWFLSILAPVLVSAAGHTTLSIVSFALVVSIFNGLIAYGGVRFYYWLKRRRPK